MGVVTGYHLSLSGASVTFLVRPHRPAGRAASEQTTAEGVLEFFRQMEKDALPLDLAAFNAYHHGGKVNGQDHEILREALGRGEAEGVQMPALRTLTARLQHP
ncbi:hypothetical protein ACFYSH_28295 [Streptomyces sp. NPDC005791]|uniref:hypothetical protein n=1 Tax=unclassified Streptomyces TaxID=2593676 RepID=UPI0033FD8A2D